MASNINPNNIDTTYPIAGQDNDSQGFRDNFTNIKTNFEYAEAEIDDLQAKVVLKSALTGTTLDNDFDGAIISNAKLQGTRYTRVALGNVTGGTATINYSAGHYYTLTMGASTTLSLTNLPATGNWAVVRVQVTTTNTAYTLTFPSAVSVNTNIQGYASNVITFAAAGVYEFEFSTNDGGSTITVNEVNKKLSPLANNSEDISGGGNADLGTSTSYFTTSAAETLSLAAGVEGQVKVLAMKGDGGDMVVTVSNAGWKSSGDGTITFDTIGQACTLQYISSKWFCIGNNGAAFT